MWEGLCSCVWFSVSSFIAFLKAKLCSGSGLGVRVCLDAGGHVVVIFGCDFWFAFTILLASLGTITGSGCLSLFCAIF